MKKPDYLEIFYLWGFDETGKLKYPPEGNYESLDEALRRQKFLQDRYGEPIMLGNYWGERLEHE